MRCGPRVPSVRDRPKAYTDRTVSHGPHRNDRRLSLLRDYVAKSGLVTALDRGVHRVVAVAPMHDTVVRLPLQRYRVGDLFVRRRDRKRPYTA